nr:unnamed protein product [Naegleria fowleri]
MNTPTIKTSLAKSPLLDATNKIQAILDKQFDKLPVTKDIPRLLKKIYLISPKKINIPSLPQDTDSSSSITQSLSVRQQDDLWKHKTDIPFNPENHSDLTSPDDIPKEIIFYQFIRAIVDDVLNASSEFNIPSYEEYISHIDFNDHRTLNNFLMNSISYHPSSLEQDDDQKDNSNEPLSGKEENKNPLLFLLKCCQQTIVINVLMGLREFTMKHKIHFKDARGAWKLWIGSDGDLSDTSTTTTSTPYDTFYVAHERSEQLYMKRLDWMQSYGISDEELAKLEANDPKEQVNFSKAAMKQLFQFKWQIKLCFSKESVLSGEIPLGENDFKLTHVTISLLGIDYSNEDLTVSHPQYCEKEIALLEQYFDMFKFQCSNSISAATDTSSLQSGTSDQFLEFSKKEMLGSPWASPSTPVISGMSTSQLMNGSKPSPLTKQIFSSKTPMDTQETHSVATVSTESVGDSFQSIKTSEATVETSIKEQEKEVSEKVQLLTFESNNICTITDSNDDNNQHHHFTNYNSISTTNEPFQQSPKKTKPNRTKDSPKHNDDMILFCIPRTLLAALPFVGVFFSKNIDHQDNSVTIHNERHHEEISEEKTLLS